MKVTWAVLAAGAAVLAGCNAEQFGGYQRIDCGATDVIMADPDLADIQATQGATALTDICAVVDAIDASTYVGPTGVKVTMPSGNVYDVQLQISQS